MQSSSSFASLSNMNSHKSISRNIPRPQYGEIRAFENNDEKKRCERLADLFAIIRVTEALESSFSRDAVSSQEYSEQCTKLISQFKTTEQAAIDSHLITSGEMFFKDFHIDCPRAYERLVRTGVPATVLHVTHDERADTAVVAQTTQWFITTMDALKLEQRAVDQIQPLLKELLGSLNKVTGLPPTFEGLSNLKLWLQKLHQMRASEELSEDEVRQLLFELDGSYASFMEHLNHGRK